MTETQEHFEAWQQTIAPSPPYVRADSIGALLARQAERRGDQLALSMLESGAGLTYAELDSQVSRFASGLAGIGVESGTRVAILLPNQIEYPIAWLALARVGAISVPLNIRHTGRELQATVRDSGAAFIIIGSDSELPEGIMPSSAIVVGAPPPDGSHAWSDLIGNGSAQFRPAKAVLSGDIASIQYTSGTTGLPKGCMQTHQFWMTAGFCLSYQRDREPFQSFLGEAPFYYFDGLAWLMAMLSCGGTLYQAERYSSSRFLEWARTSGAESAYLPRTWGDAMKGMKEHNLQHFTGFVLTPDLVAEVYERFGVPVREAYGMTEIGGCLRVHLADTDPAAIGTCGTPTPTYDLMILGDDGHEVAPGEAGELCVRGPGVFAGYWNRPEANATSFVDGWFRTGDLFIQDPSGYFRIVGRLKEMIKRSGENISASEVEAVIRSYHGIADVAVISVPDAYRDEEVLAVVQLWRAQDRALFDPVALRVYCEERLAQFKCPRFISVVDQLPYIRDQKIDKMALRNTGDLRSGSWDCEASAWIP